MPAGSGPGNRTHAAHCTIGAWGVRENAAGRRNERKGRSTPRTIRDSGRAKGWSPAAFERGRGSDPRWGAARDPMEFPKGKRDRRANGQRHEKKLAPVAESGAADAADREPVDHCDHRREFFSARWRTGGDAGRGARDGDRDGRGRGRVRRRKNDCDRREQEKKYVPAAPCGEAGGGDPARVRHRDRRGARTGSLWKLEIGRTDASGTRSGGRRRR